MTEATTSGRGGIELLADDLVEPATLAKHLEAIRQAEQWMKVKDRYGEPERGGVNGSR
jgi:hypothetical protein